MVQMRIFAVLLLITLLYQVESRWNHHNEHNHFEQTSKDNDGRYTVHDVSHKKHYQHGENKNKYENYQKDLRPHYNNNKHSQKPSTVGPPDHNQIIAMARYVIHNADWASIATISTTQGIEGFPFTNVKSMVDGYIANSTGVPYFYMSPLDFTARDLTRNTRATILATLEETKFCEQNNYDPEDPRCTRVMLSGKIKKLKENTTEHIFAKGAMFERHPTMASYPADHDFFVAKLKIAQIVMVDWFGGAKYIPVRDYLAFNYSEAAMKH